MKNMEVNWDFYDKETKFKGVLIILNHNSSYEF